MLPMIQKRTEFLKSKSRQFGIDVGRAFDFFLGVVWEWFGSGLIFFRNESSEQ